MAITTKIINNAKLITTLSLVALAGYFGGNFAKSNLAGSLEYRIEKKQDKEFLVAKTQKLPINSSGQSIFVGTLDYAISAIQQATLSSENHNEYLNNLVCFSLSNTDSLTQENLEKLLHSSKIAFLQNKDFAEQLVNIIDLELNKVPKKAQDKSFYKNSNWVKKLKTGYESLKSALQKK